MESNTESDRDLFRVNNPARLGATRSLFHIAFLACCFGCASVLTADLPTLLKCPDGHSLCELEGKMAKAVWSSTQSGPLVDFEQLPDGKVVVLSRGHQEPGRLTLLDPGYDEILRRELSDPSPFHALYSSDDAGTAVLCNEGRMGSICDVWIRSLTQVEPPRRRSLPTNCLYPELDPDLGYSCFDIQNGDLRISDLEGRYPRYRFRLEEKLISSLFRVEEDRVLVRYGGGSLVMHYSALPGKPGKDGKAVEISGNVTSLIKKKRGEYYYSYCDEVGHLDGKSSCSIALLDEGVNITPIWGPESFYPGHLAIDLETGDLIVDLIGQDERRVVRIGENGELEVLWKAQI